MIEIHIKNLIENNIYIWAEELLNGFCERIFSLPSSASKLQNTINIARKESDESRFGKEKVLDGFNTKHIKIKKKGSGKPFLEGFGDVFISLSHSQGQCVVAMSTNNIGIDLQFMKNNNWERMAKRLFPSLKINTKLDFYCEFCKAEALAKLKEISLAAAILECEKEVALGRFFGESDSFLGCGENKKLKDDILIDASQNLEEFEVIEKVSLEYYKDIAFDVWKYGEFVIALAVER